MRDSFPSAHMQRPDRSVGLTPSFQLRRASGGKNDAARRLPRPTVHRRKRVVVGVMPCSWMAEGSSAAGPRRKPAVGYKRKFASRFVRSVALLGVLLRARRSFWCVERDSRRFDDLHGYDSTCGKLDATFENGGLRRASRKNHS